jgi:hypothetical protein
MIHQKHTGQIDQRDEARRAQSAPDAEPQTTKDDWDVTEPNKDIMRGLLAGSSEEEA